MGTYYSGIMNSYFGRELYHHGVAGQKWGTRKYQNIDGTLTDAGREHYGIGDEITQEGKDQESSAVINKIKSMYSQLKDKDTSKELDFYLYKLRSGTMSAEQALQAAQEAVALDAERVAYKAKQQEKANKQNQKRNSGSSKAKSSSNSSNSSKSTSDSKVYSDTTLKANEQFVNTQRQNEILSKIEALLNNVTQSKTDNSSVLNEIRNAIQNGNTSKVVVKNSLEKQRIQNKNYVDYVKARQKLLRTLR